MRVNQPQIRGNQQKMQGQKPTLQNNANYQNIHHETEVMRLARKIKTEQGGITAGYFLFAMKPFIAPNEILFIERELNIKCECDPRLINQFKLENRNNKGGFNPQILQMLMGVMRGGGKMDPMALLKMMNNSPKN